MSIIELAEQGHAPHDPELGWLVGGQADGGDKVGGVTCGRECAGARRRAVERTLVGVPDVAFSVSRFGLEHGKWRLKRRRRHLAVFLLWGGHRIVYVHRL